MLIEPGARFFVDGLFGYGTLNFDSRRYITASGDFAYGERDGSQSEAHETNDQRPRL